MQKLNMGKWNRNTDRVKFEHLKKQKIWKNIEHRIGSDYLVHIQFNLIALID